MKVITIDEFSLIVQNIPTVLQYFLPGYWAIMLFSFFNSKKTDAKTLFVLSCLFSYLSLTLISLFYQTESVLILSGISFALLTVLTILASIIYSTKWFRALLVRSFHKTPYSDIWRDTLDFDNGSNLRVYFKNSNIGIIGHHKVHEENGEASWFAVSAPIKFNTDTDETIDDKNMDNEDFVVTFRLCDVEHIEIF